MTGRLAAILTFFGLRVASALLLLKLSASFLSVSGFAALAQLLAYSALLNLVAIGGTQSGIIRQVAAADGPDAANRTHCAALFIWIMAAPLLLLAAMSAGGWISTILLGTPDRRDVVIVLTLLALAAGPGQIWCSILSGSDRGVVSLGAQATGLLAGISASAAFIVRGQVAAASIAFACGPLVTACVALALLKPRLRLAPRPAIVVEASNLLRYSAALAAVSGSAAVTYFALRSLYRETFGAIALGHWMAANRISDLSTQLVGLFMLQVFVPHLSKIASETERRRFVQRCGFAGMAVMALPLLVFSFASAPLVRLFLSDAFLPAIPVIRAYMAGDMLRVWVSLAMFTAFAAGAPGRYAAIEIGALAIMAVATATLIAAGDASAPQWGYLIAYGSVATIAVAFLLRQKHHVRTASITADTA